MKKKTDFSNIPWCDGNSIDNMIKVCVKFYLINDKAAAEPNCVVKNVSLSMAFPDFE